MVFLLVSALAAGNAFGQGGATGGRDSNLRSNDFTAGKGLLAGVSHLPAMIPTITGIALAVRGPLAPPPHVAGAAVKPGGAGGQLADRGNSLKWLRSAYRCGRFRTVRSANGRPIRPPRGPQRRLFAR